MTKAKKQKRAQGKPAPRRPDPSPLTSCLGSFGLAGFSVSGVESAVPDAASPLRWSCRDTASVAAPPMGISLRRAATSD